MSGDEFQTRYLAGMDSMLKTAAAEATKLFETMVNELKEEIAKIKKENEDLKSKCSYLELLTNRPKPDVNGVNSEHGPATARTCDTGVQCDLCCNEQGFRNSLPQQEDDQKREDLQNQQLCHIYGDGHVLKDGILEPALVQKEVPDSLTPLDSPGQKVDCNKLLMAGNMLCNFERVEESELESPPGEEQSQKISQQVLRVDETIANEDNVTMRASVNIEVMSEQPIQLSEELSFSMKGASCDSEVDLAEIGVNFLTDSSPQINTRRRPQTKTVDGKVQSPPVNSDIRHFSSVISATTRKRGRPPKKTGLIELRTPPQPDTAPRTGRPRRKPKCRVGQLPSRGTTSPPPSSGILPAKGASNTPSKHVKLGQDSCVPLLAASLIKGHSSDDVELSGLHQVSTEMEETGVPSAAEMEEPPRSELPTSKSIGPRKSNRNPQLQEALLLVEAISPQTFILYLDEDSSSLPDMTVPAQPQNTPGFTSSNASLTPSLSISPASPQTTTTNHTSDPSTVVCQMANSLPTLHQSTKEHSVPQPPLCPQNAVVSASTPSAVVTSRTQSNVPTKLKQDDVIVPKSNAASEAIHTRTRSRLQLSFTSISPVEASNDRLGDANTKKISETKFTSPQTMMQGKSSSHPDFSACAEGNAAYLKAKNTTSASEGPCVMNCGQKDLPTMLTEVQPSKVALTQSTLAPITELCLVSKTLPSSTHSSSSLNKAFTKGCTVKALKQVAQEGTSAVPTPLFNDTVHPHSEITKTMFFAQLSMAPVVPLQEKVFPNDGMDCVVAESTTHNTRSRFRKRYMKRLKEPGPSLSSAETTSKSTEVSPKVGNLDTDEYSPDNTRELAQKLDVSPKYNANKEIARGLKGFRIMPNKFSRSAKKYRLSQERASPKESVSLVNNARIQTIVKTEAVWTPPILEASKSPLRNDNCIDRILTKWTARSAAPKWRTGSRLVTRKHRPPSTPSVSSSSGSPSAPRTIRYSHRGTSHPTPATTSPIQSPVIGERLLRNQCEQCGRVLSSTAALQRHVRLHLGQRPFSCTLCGQSFPDSKALSRHGRVHRNGTIYICPQCNEGFAYRFGLTKHLQMVHSRIKPFVCQICHKGYFRRKDVESHIRVHTKARQFPCNFCDKRFNRRVELGVHLRRHSGEKKHCCPYCGKEFLDYNNLKRHKYTHTGERPYSCPHCTKSFVQSGHLKKHLRNVHKVDVYADSQ